jgi:hypothetical protein
MLEREVTMVEVRVELNSKGLYYYCADTRTTALFTVLYRNF